jgi:hypothetical protein
VPEPDGFIGEPSGVSSGYKAISKTTLAAWKI